MKKVVFTVILITFTAISFAQESINSDLEVGNFQVNGGLGFSNWGIPIYVGVDYGIIEDITIGAEMSYRTKSSYSAFGISVNGNYHFNKILKLPSNFDFYSGINLGYYSWSVDGIVTNPAYSSGIGFSAQIGGRYFFDKQFGLNLELGGGNVSGSKFGITYRF